MYKYSFFLRHVINQKTTEKRQKTISNNSQQIPIGMHIPSNTSLLFYSHCVQVLRLST